MVENLVASLLRDAGRDSVVPLFFPRVFSKGLNLRSISCALRTIRPIASTEARLSGAVS